MSLLSFTNLWFTSICWVDYIESLSFTVASDFKSTATDCLSTQVREGRLLKHVLGDSPSGTVLQILISPSFVYLFIYFIVVKHYIKHFINISTRKSASDFQYQTVTITTSQLWIPRLNTKTVNHRNLSGSKSWSFN